jgi:hypothetical protein
MIDPQHQLAAATLPPSRRTSRERRRSGRWTTDELLAWRLHRGRRPRRGRVIERSLDCLTIAVAPHDEPPAGARLHPFAPIDHTRFGFRSALVKRTEPAGKTLRLVFLEIEA